MPTLNWIGKDKVLNHHNAVPYCVLEKKYSYGTDEGENRIIHGDNLEALKALLPEFEGRVKCIYIDPPYNTGNEGWVYNDNVNDPKIKKWLGEVVGKEGEDLSRHDKWLCMMYPRLRLLQKLLAEDGVIFISIDDNELYNLKLICDEIFGLSCFVSNISWQRTYSMRNDVKGIAAEVEHILVYSGRSFWQPNKLPRTRSMDSKYKNPDNDPKGAWRNVCANAPDSVAHQGMVYAIQNPITLAMEYPPSGRHWSLGQEQMLEAMREWCEYELRDIGDAKRRAEVCGIDEAEVRKNVLAIVVKHPNEATQKMARKKYDEGVLPEFYYSKNGEGALGRKAYVDSVGGRAVTNYWSFEETGHTDEAARMLKTIFEGRVVFDTPKPTRLIERVLQIATDKDSIILDSFAGSGTTAHAVLKANQADGGHRRFILIETEDYADTITAERVRRVIDGYGEGNKAVEGTGGGFSFYELGERMFLEDGTINPRINDWEIKKYIWFMETHSPYLSPCEDEPYLLGLDRDTAYYLVYEQDAVTVLDTIFLSKIKTKADGYVIYADTCTVSDEKLLRYNITFKKIPRDIAK